MFNVLLFFALGTEKGSKPIVDMVLNEPSFDFLYKLSLICKGSVNAEDGVLSFLS